MIITQKENTIPDIAIILPAKKDTTRIPPQEYLNTIQDRRIDSEC